MRCRVGPRSALALALALSFASRVAGQDVGLASEGPRFLAISPVGSAPVDASRAAVLQRRVTFQVTGVTAEEALWEISRRANVRFVYSEDLVRLDRKVSLEVKNLTVAAVLTDVLLGTGLDVLVLRDGQLGLVRKDAGSRAKLQSGVVVGRVTDAKTGEGLAGADVSLDRTRWRTGTTADGRYRLAEVAPGEYALVVRRIGYGRRTQSVTVPDGEEVTVDVALEPVPTQLDEVVTTVTGEQRLRELGHVVGRINADSLVKEAPVSNLSELLTGRVAGLRVYQNQGSVGGEVHLQIRGANSLLLSTEPIVIVDGVRYTSEAAPGFSKSFVANVERSSPLNDINPNDIASIEVVKGPSAATLYGTDASNGAIVITTKPGRAGATRWTAYGRGLRSVVPTQNFRDKWRGWGNVSGDPAGNCPLSNVVGGYCTQDSITIVRNPLNDPALSIFQDATSWEYGANASGGSDRLRYYFGGSYENATGPVRMPPAMVEQLTAARGVSELPEEVLAPNALDKLNLRANVSAGLGSRAEVQVQAGYLHGSSRALPLGSSDPYAYGLIYGTPTEPYGREGTDPTEAFNQHSTEVTDRFFGSATGHWRPQEWLTLRATVGQDVSSRNRTSLARRGALPSSIYYSNGAVAEDRGRQITTTAQLAAQAVARKDRLSSRTSVGVQYVRSQSDVVSANGRDLPPGGTSIGEAAMVTTAQSYGEAVTLGSYVEQMVGLNDRLFLTGALRVDGASAFGQDYDAAAYPKLSASWLASEEPFFPRLAGLDELRLRYAFGASGRQAVPAMTRPTFGTGPLVMGGAITTVIGVTGLGNPALKPERAAEHELGFDVAGLSGRLRLGMTWYRRTTSDAIVNIQLPPGYGSAYTNLGLVKQHGFELELTASVLNGRRLSWDLMLQHGLHRTRVVDLGGAPTLYHPSGGYVEGYPVGARFVQPLAAYDDLNGDGIIEPRTEITYGDWQYAGESSPPSSQTLSTVVGLFDRRVRLSALVERRAGYTQVDRLQTLLCTSASCRAKVDPSTPLEEQAEVWARSYRTVNTFLADADFTRLREVTVSFDVPLHIVRAMRIQSATVSLSGRNLALWTDFPAPDPESSQFAPLSYGNAQAGATGIPQSRTWALRLDVAF